MILADLVVVDSIDDGDVGAVGGRRDENALGAGRKMRRGLFLRGEDAGALHRDIDVELLVRKLGRVLDRRHLDRAAADIHRVAGDFDLVREAAVHRVEAQEMRVGLDRREVVDGDDFDILAAGFDNGAQDVAPNAPETIDGDTNRHRKLL
jgi:hypothetical protein